MDLDFSSLAPRRGTQPLLGSHFGTSDLSGGAINWSGIWSGLKSFGSNIKHWGNKAWNSSTGQALRQKLKDTDLQGKVVEGISTGIHGAIDVARQELDRRLEQKLGPKPVPQVEPSAPPEDVDKPSPIPSTDKTVPAFKGPVKRPVADLPPGYETTLIQTLDEPPSYEEAVGSQPPPRKRPTTRPIAPMVTEVLPAPPAQTATTLELPRPSQAAVVTPAPPVSFVPRPMNRLPGNWQSKLQNVVGAGLRCSRRRRCF